MLRNVLRKEILGQKAAKNTWSYGHEEKSKRIDGNTVLRNENETGDDIPHFFVDLKDIKRFFAGFEWICFPVEECAYRMDEPSYYSVHWKILGKGIK